MRSVLNIVKAMDEKGFGQCSVTGACEVECLQLISLDIISEQDREYIKAQADKK